MAGEVVRIHNKGEAPFVGGYAQNRYVIPVEGVAVVPIEAAQHWAGRWYLNDRDRHKERTTEYERLMVLYGIFDDAHESGITTEEKRETQIPKFEVYDLDGNQITTVLDDPTGKGSNPVDTTKMEKELIDERIAELTRQVTALTAAKAAAEISKDGTYEESTDEVPKDTPTRVPVTDGPRRGRTSASS